MNSRPRSKVRAGVIVFAITAATLFLTMFLASAALQPPSAPTTLTLPLIPGSFRFAVMGDTGRGQSGQYDVAKQMTAFHAQFPFDLVIMVGDNIYGSDGPDAMLAKFATPYKPLLDAGVEFRAALGNHDSPNQRFYKAFNMGGERYYSFHPPKGAAGRASSSVRFFALDTNYLEKVQLDWLEQELAASRSEWKIAFFHHPLYSSGKKHGSGLELRAVLEPLFVKYGVSAVFAGHDHLYERVKPQKGIAHWVTGAGGSLRKGGLRQGSALTAVGFDRDYHFMMVELAGDDLHFQVISRRGKTVDSGVFRRPGAVAVAASPAPAPVAVPVAPVPVPVPTTAPVSEPTPKATPTAKASPTPTPQ